MKILYIGDIMGRPGRKIVSKLLPGIKINHDIDLVVAQSENISHGKGMSQKHFNQLEEAGVDGFSGGNHSFERQQNIKMVLNPELPVVAPANVLGHSYGNYKIITKGDYKVAIVSLLGYTIPKGYRDNTENPLICIDKLLPVIKKLHKGPILVNFHGDVSSEKVVIGHYLDGKVTAVIGDHWHVPTADERILSKGTAHVTDVGMCGVLDSSLGIDWHLAVDRWLGKNTKFKLYDKPPYQFNAVLVKTNLNNNVAKSIERIQIYTD
ncbi:MAG: YmdB family metallophosphoesterase [Patescibacteria group bacterium]|jgi:metallophosphoesterase (TIGR00282 family)|nr:YmdB family metallophosphoesterase [Patescibacteria group bacterium]